MVSPAAEPAMGAVVSKLGSVMEVTLEAIAEVIMGFIAVPEVARRPLATLPGASVCLLRADTTLKTKRGAYKTSLAECR